ncbi:hypothetical protein CYY_003212 [Polysphondylium violaceum]|uniref:DNA topoisomerase 2 n=1 Tax=Polysphondylium violaceum TaxID=133409 RepID=A0A8J4Q732_9MYCE|nr:hypothetical protein CYY_003212 [Polysphondylium violaceum]
MSRLLVGSTRSTYNKTSCSLSNLFKGITLVSNSNQIKSNRLTVSSPLSSSITNKCYLFTSTNNSNNSNSSSLSSFYGTTTATSTKLNNIEDIYQKKTPTEHVLLRPDSYIGTIEKVEDDMWVLSNSIFNKKKKEIITPSTTLNNDIDQDLLVKKKKNQQHQYIHPIKATYTPGLLKIYDEILVNAADNKQRDSTMSFIKVEIDPTSQSISIMNDGKGIPVVMHKTEQCYVVEMVMGNLMSGSNFNDNELKVVGGRNGFGAKLTNIFSKEFIVETVDTQSGKKYSQRWRNNMSVREDPVIKTIQFGETDFTKITFKPDLEKFKIKSLWDDDILSLMERRLYDIAACNPELKIYLNDQPINHNFNSYVKLYEHHLSSNNKTGKDDVTHKTKEELKEESFVFGDIGGGRWKIGMGLSETGQFTQVSFVNSINTLKGGSHVNSISDQIVKYVAEKLKRKHADLEIRPMNIKNHLAVFVNCLIDNPSFDSQTKETLTTKSSLFGSVPEIPDHLLAQFVKTSNIIEKVAGWAMMKQKADLIHSTSTRSSKTTLIKSIHKLDDANWAGGARSRDCTLIITEGDSAKSLAVAGLSVVGRNSYGVFPLRGKLLNVRDQNPKTLMANEEINNLIAILGLQHKKTYQDQESLNELRYGKILIMTDQDHDGSHIKGLLINFIHHFWPSLLKQGFIQEFVTPIIKATPHNSKKESAKKSFFTINDYLKWKEQDPSNIKNYSIKYYKGLGTSTSAEAKEYFSNLDHHVIDFKWADKTDELISMAFSKDSAEGRQKWIKESDLSQSIDHSIKEITYPEFINKELIHFSWAANIRSIPSIIDGLKPGQRKILYACFKRKLTSEIKVAQLSGYVAEHTAYHHGEASLNATIVKMAQSYVGSNNIPLLYAGGQFGTRLQGGSDCASPRYIFTKLESVVRHLYNELDDPLLNYLEEEGDSIQPEFYVPIIPMVLVNGSEGIGVGMATSVPLLSPIDIIDHLVDKINKKPSLTHLIPWYRGFKGSVVKQSNNSYKTSGVIRLDEKNIVIEELPIGKWSTDYKEVLNELMDNDVIRSFQESNTENTVSFTVLLNPLQYEEMEDLTENELLKLFKLNSVVHPNLTLFDENGRIQKYDSFDHIIDSFFKLRLEYYHKRRDYLLNHFSSQIKRLTTTKQFLEIISSGKILIAGKTKSQLIDELVEKFNFGPHTPETYQHLFSLSILDITKEKIDHLDSQISKRNSEFKAINNSNAEELWLADLKNLRDLLLKDKSYSRRPIKVTGVLEPEVSKKKRTIKKKSTTTKK